MQDISKNQVCYGTDDGRVGCQIPYIDNPSTTFGGPPPLHAQREGEAYCLTEKIKLPKVLLAPWAFNIKIRGLSLRNEYGGAHVPRGCWARRGTHRIPS